MYYDRRLDEDEVIKKYFGERKVFDVRITSSDYDYMRRSNLPLVEKKIKDFKDEMVTIDVSLNNVKKITI